MIELSGASARRDILSHGSEHLRDASWLILYDRGLLAQESVHIGLFLEVGHSTSS